MAAGVLLSAVVGGDWSPSQFDRAFAEVLWWSGTIAVGLSIALLGLAVLPRVSHGEAREKLYYFGHVVQYQRRTRLGARAATGGPTEEFLRGLQNPPDSLRRTGDQIWIISAFVDAKYRYIRLALILQGIGIALVSIAALLDL